jgi:4-hydroxybenzoate polyprenyltransferase
MMRQIWKYLLATRPFESALMIGFPLIGALIGLREWTGVGRLVLHFFVATYPLVMYVYCLNSFGGLSHDAINERLYDNPAVTGEVSPNELIGLAFGGAFLSGLLYFLWFPRCLVPWLLIVINWTLYSYPRVYAKGRPIAGSLVHFIGGVLQFLLGYAATHPLDRAGLLLGVYFALAFAAGHLNHEVKDFEPDQAAGLHTNAVAFGPRRVFSAAFFIFFAAFVYLLFLSVFRVIAWRYSWPYLAIFFPHLLLHIRATGRQWTGYDRTYQFVYRALFVLAGFALAGAKWLTVA